MKKIIKQILIALLAIASYSPIFSASHSIQTIFTHIYTTGLWTDHEKESVSGEGSKLDATKIIRKKLPQILNMLGVQTLLDIPCGDFNWMKTVNLGSLHYKGADIVEELIQKNQRLYGNSQRTFTHLDATSDPLPKVDVILCRDCLAHLSYASIVKAIQNFKNSGARYLITSNFNGSPANQDIPDGSWQALNLQLPPFNFPQPLIAINEHAPRGVDKSFKKHLVVWDLQTIDVATLTPF